MISLQQAFQILDEIVAANMQLSTEQCALPLQCLQRVLAESQTSRLNLPAFNKSAMDGYALLADDTSDEYAVLGTVAAGTVAQQQLTPGATVKVMTGAPVPAGAARVVPHEFTAEQNGRMRIVKTPPPVTNICWCGEDVRQGDAILPRGTVIGAAEIANLAACGIKQAPVFKRPRVAIISTGDEIVADIADLAPGKIMDSNGPLLQALCAQYALDVVAVLTVSDDYNATIAALKTALAQADIILLSGGVSAGECDYVTQALTAAGLHIHFNRVSMKPGKPMTFAARPHNLVFGLPGNPVAVFLTFHLFVLRALRVMFGAVPDDEYITLPLAEDFGRVLADRTEYVPCKLRAGRIEFAPCELRADGSVMPLECHGSAHLAALLNGKTYKEFFVIDKGVDKLRAGYLVQVVRF